MLTDNDEYGTNAGDRFGATLAPGATAFTQGRALYAAGETPGMRRCSPIRMATHGSPAPACPTASTARRSRFARLAARRSRPRSRHRAAAAAPRSRAWRPAAMATRRWCQRLQPTVTETPNVSRFRPAAGATSAARRRVALPAGHSAFEDRRGADRRRAGHGLVRAGQRGDRHLERRGRHARGGLRPLTLSTIRRCGGMSPLVVQDDS